MTTHHLKNLAIYFAAFCFLLSNVTLVSGQDKAKKMDSLISAYHQLNLFNGSILVARKGKIVFKKSYGMANKEFDIPNSTTTKFRIGSISKQFTAMLIMQLKQAGKLDLQGKITDYLPWYRKETGNKITVHNLLTHTSGLPNYTELPNFVSELGLIKYEPKDFALKYCSGDLEFEPGTKQVYCNTDYFLLGLIVEAVAGQPFDQVLKQNILDVAGMNNTGIDHPEEIVKNRAAGYDYTFDGYVNTDYINMASAVFGCGAMYSTVEDLYRWDRILYTNKLLSAENMKIYFTPFLEDYAYGWIVRKHKNFMGLNAEMTTIAHAGGINGFSSMIGRIPEDESFFILLDNSRAGTRGGLLDGVIDDVITIMYNKPVSMPKPLPAYALYDKLKTSNVRESVAYYNYLKKNEQAKYNFNTVRNDLNNLGRFLDSKNRAEDALAVYQLNADENPSSPEVSDTYAAALLKAGQKEAALKRFKKSLELDPNDQHAKEQIKKIEGNQ
jgi:CubicO group peptidase (beta-lactamase class C family)